MSDKGYAHDPSRWRVGRFVLGGTLVIGALFGGLGWWSANTEIAGAVIAPGELRVESKQKPVAHPEGGVVGEILVREGQRVSAGDPLIRLDRTTQTATLGIVDAQLDELSARRARLLAERDGGNAVTFETAVLARAGQRPDVAKIVNDERGLFDARLQGYRQRAAQLRERIGQLEQEIAGGGSRRYAYADQLRSVEDEIARFSTLLERGLTTRTRVQEYMREKARIQGEMGALDAEAARLRRQIQETRIEIGRLEEGRREGAIAELREVETRLAELRQRRVVAEDTLRRVDLRSPQDGVVQDLAVFAPGAVVAPGEPVMVIVPVADDLVLEAAVDPVERDRIALGRPARVRFTSFNQRTTPELQGEIAKISADRKEDPQTGARYYAVEIAIPDEERARLGTDNELVPGLPAEIMIETELRTPLSYLLKPLRDGVERSFRED